MFEAVGNEPADRFAVVVPKFGGEVFVEGFDFEVRSHAPAVRRFLNDDARRIVPVEFVRDVPHDLLEHVFDRDEARDAAEFVDDERKVTARALEVAQKDVDRLRFGNEARRPQELAHVEFGIDHEAQKVLGVQNPLHVVKIAVHGGKARVTAFDHGSDPIVKRPREIDLLHLCTRNHQVVRPQIRDLQGPLHHGERLLVHDVVRLGVAHETQKSAAVFDLFIMKGGGESVEKRFRFRVGRFV